jgi:N-hydroxyarylamine O-acetyltransferase
MSDFRDQISDQNVSAALRRIGVEREPPSAEALARVHRAWVEQVPYESIWIHMSDRWSIDPAESLHRIASQSRGGYCYQMNGALALVLRSLGYEVTGHIGGVHGPDGPDFKWLTNHLVLVAHNLPTPSNPEGTWYVDAGLGDGLHDPLPMIAGTYEQGPLTFRLEPSDDGVGDWHFTHDPTGSFTGMSFLRQPVEMDVFAERHEHLSTAPDSGFAEVVTAQLRLENGTDILRGCVLTRRRDKDSTSTTLDDRTDWFDALDDVFAIRPDAPKPALDALWARVTAAHERWLQRDLTPDT